MLTKAIIEKLEADGTQAKVRIPILHKIANATGATPFDELPVAAICFPPGCKPFYKVGDIVYVEFENNNTSNPVIMGALLLKDFVGEATLNGTSLNVTVDTHLSNETVIGDVTMVDIEHLRYTKSNLQGQIDRLTEIVNQLQS